MLYDLALSITQKEREDIANFFNPKALDLLKKLSLLEIDQQQKNSRRGKIEAFTQLASIGTDKMNDMMSLDLTRHVPFVKIMIEEIVQDRIYTDYGNIFIPSTWDGSLQKKSKVSVNKLLKLDDDKEKQKRKRPKLIFYILGGISFAELRTLHEYQATANSGYDIIYGGDCVLRPVDFVSQVKSILDPEEKAKLGEWNVVE